MTTIVDMFRRDSDGALRSSIGNWLPGVDDADNLSDAELLTYGIRRVQTYSAPPHEWWQTLGDSVVDWTATPPFVNWPPVEGALESVRWSALDFIELDGDQSDPAVQAAIVVIQAATDVPTIVAEIDALDLAPW